MENSILPTLTKRHSRKLGPLSAAILFVVAVTAVLLASAVFSPVAQAVSYSDEEIAVVQMLNDYRTSQGLQPLLVSDTVSLASDRHNSDMGKYGFFSHYTVASDWFASGAAPWDRMAVCGYNYNTYMGENIAAGYTTAAAVFAGWKGSPDHNAIMLNPNFKVVGVSLVYVSGSTYGYYWTTDFGGYVDPTAHSIGSGTTTTLPPTTSTTLPPTTTTTEPTATTTSTTTTTVYVPTTTTSTSSTSTTAGSTTTTIRPTTTTVRPTTTTTVKPAPTFSDVNSSTLYADEIWLLAENGIISGYSDGTFGPNYKVTRQQFAKMIVLTLGYEVSPVYTCAFKDVLPLPNSSDPLYPRGYVAVCAAEGITVGTSADTFSPYGQITRAQLITMVARAAGLADPPATYEPPFGNFSATHYPWARKAAYAGLLDGLVGLGPNFNFWAAASRGEVCLLLANLLDE